MQYWVNLIYRVHTGQCWTLIRGAGHYFTSVLYKTKSNVMKISGHLMKCQCVSAQRQFIRLCGAADNPRLISKALFNTLGPRQNGRHFANDIFKCIFLKENVWIPIKISMKFVLKGQINNIPALVQIMAWRRPGDKPLSEPMMVNLTTHICVTRPQWGKMT